MTDRYIHLLLLVLNSQYKLGCHGRDRMVVGLITTCAVNAYDVVSSNSVHGDVYSIQHYVLKFVSDLRQVGGFLRVLLFTPPIKVTAAI